MTAFDSNIANAELLSVEDVDVEIGKTTFFRNDKGHTIAANTHHDEGPIELDAVEHHGDSSEVLPPVFYCPVTEERLNDPVVFIEDGKSYERSAVVSVLLQRFFYPNRALKSILNDDKAASSSAGTGSRFQTTQARQRGMISIVSEEQTSVCSLPSAYYCPITLSLMHDPVIDPEGNTYERTAIEAWIREHHVSPVTRTELSLGSLVPNHAIADLLTMEANSFERDTEDGVLFHPSIRQWRTEELLRSMATSPSAATDSCDWAATATNINRSTAVTQSRDENNRVIHSLELPEPQQSSTTPTSRNPNSNGDFENSLAAFCLLVFLVLLCWLSIRSNGN